MVKINWKSVIEIIGVIGIMFSIFYSIYLYNHPPANKPNLYITAINEPSSFGYDASEHKLLFIQNLGNAPCVGVEIVFPNRGLMQLLKLYDYEGYSLAEVQNNTIKYPPIKQVELYEMDSNYSKADIKESLGVIMPGKFFTYKITAFNSDKTPYTLKVICSGKEKTYTIYF